MKSLSFIAIALCVAGLCAAQTQSPLTQCSLLEAGAAVTDYSVSSQEGGHVLYLFNTSFTNGIQRFVFLNGGLLTLNGTSATLSGRLVGLGASNQNGFDLLLSLSPSLGTPMPMGMDELLDSVNVDMASWTYYSVASPSSLTGFGTFQGITLGLEQQMDTMPMQIGVGANGKNLDFGGAVWLNVILGNDHIAADINVDFNCTREGATPSVCPGQSTMQASAAQVDSYAQFTGGVAFSFFDAPSQIGAGSWVFSDNSGVLISAAGQLHLTGTIVPLDASQSGSFSVNLLFSSPSQAELMSIQMMPPHTELTASAYVAQNGPINPDSWSFFLIDTNASSIWNVDTGVQIKLATQMGMPLQIGIGANGKNIQFGASGWFDYTVSSMLEHAPFTPVTGAMDINLDLNCTALVTAPSSPSECSLNVVPTLRTFWPQGSQNITLWDVTVLNTGSKAVSEASIQIVYPAVLGCSAGSCISQSWNLDQDSNGSGEYNLPSWLTDFGGLAQNAMFTFGIISTEPDVTFSATPVCA